MVSYPLALLPVVSLSDGQAPLPPGGYGASPGAGTARKAIEGWAAHGAPWIHIVDQDAIDGTGDNLRHIVRGPAHLQYSGAVADDTRLAAALASGASRVVIESTDLEWALHAVSGRDDRIAVALDVRAPDVLDAVGRLQHGGASRFVVTDTAEHHHWRHEDRHLLAELCERTSRPVMARGGIAHLSDLHGLHELVPHGVDGILIDDALYSGAFTYAEAVTASADRFDLFFWGPPS
jgi:phosphoribosylformimino-5-aminoimidazole carboxamide ribotide isomerase/phosphoribosylanthranilate isomerase